MNCNCWTSSTLRQRRVILNLALFPLWNIKSGNSQRWWYGSFWSLSDISLLFRPKKFVAIVTPSTVGTHIFIHTHRQRVGQWRCELLWSRSAEPAVIQQRICVRCQDQVKNLQAAFNVVPPSAVGTLSSILSIYSHFSFESGLYSSHLREQFIPEIINAHFLFPCIFLINKWN